MAKCTYKAPGVRDKLGLVGTHDDLVERIATLEASGIGELVLQPVLDPARKMADFARLL